jgi:hypothetical protein
MVGEFVVAAVAVKVQTAKAVPAANVPAKQAASPIIIFPFDFFIFPVPSFRG